MKRLVDLGVDGILTNHADKLLNVLERREESLRQIGSLPQPLPYIVVPARISTNRPQRKRIPVVGDGAEILFNREQTLPSLPVEWLNRSPKSPE